MAIATSTLLTALMTGFKKTFQDAFGEAKSDYEKIATVVPSSTKSNTYGWLGKFPNFREWIGERVLKDMKAAGYSITNKDWESTVAVDRTDIEDDNLGVYAPIFQEMGRAAKVHPDQMVFGLLKKGDVELCYDGQPFFDADHPAYENVDGTGTVSTQSNIQEGTGAAWFLMDTSRAIKPIIYQNRKSPVFTAMTKTDDESVFMSNEFRYGVDSRSNVGFGFWQLGFMSKAPLNAENLNAAIAAMMGYTTDGGEPLGIMPTLLVCGAANRAAALEAVKTERNANGATNINRNAVETLITPRLT